jgi:cell wall-associated NlpC family hydrolase
MAAAVISGCGQSGGGPGGRRSSQGAKATGPSAVAGVLAGTAGGSNAGAIARQIADPEEAKSFPAPPSVHHKPAATPTRAAEAEFHPSPGAPSNAEVSSQLRAEERLQSEERSSKRLELIPVPGGQSIGGAGAIPIPAAVPEVVQKVVAGANAIADFPYVFGGGHASFVDSAYDCSGSVSYALAAGGLLAAPETSGALESWGAPGPGRYITVYATAGHTYMYVNGILYDTAGRSGVYASRWQVSAVDNSGYVARHWPGL